MIDRRSLMAGLALGCAAAPARLAAQEAAPLIGFLSSASQPQWQPFVAAFENGLATHGFRAGQNIRIVSRWADGANDRLPRLVDELLALGVKLLVATGGPDPAKAVKAATSTVPVVFTVGPDPVELGLVQSLSRPGGNLTGFTLFTGELTSKRFELLRELVPAARTIAVLTNLTSQGAPAQLADLGRLGSALGLRLVVIEASSDAEIDEAIMRRSAATGADAIFVASDSFYYARADRIAALVAARKLPAVYEARGYAVAGGLMSYGADFVDVYRRAGGYAARILKGERPADLPVEQPSRLELVINLKSASALGITVPPSILVRADEVIE